jgi:hypothetical protein
MPLSWLKLFVLRFSPKTDISHGLVLTCHACQKPHIVLRSPALLSLPNWLIAVALYHHGGAENFHQRLLPTIRADANCIRHRTSGFDHFKGNLVSIIFISQLLVPCSRCMHPYSTNHARTGNDQSIRQQGSDESASLSPR